MISATPSLLVSSRSTHRPAGIRPVLERYARAYARYGSGKAALRDGLAGLVEAGENVLLPAYLPDAVAEPFADLGLEVRYYALEPSLAPDVDDLRSRVDAATAAVLSVDYFGFPQPNWEAVRSVAAEHDCYYVDDNAHAPISVDDGTLLGTRGHVGITSLWKLLPIPDGAVLYLNDEEAIESYRPSSAAGVRDRVDGSDCRFVVKSIAEKLFDETGAVRQTIDAVRTPPDDTPAVGGPRERYERSLNPMSRLSAAVVDEADPEAIRSARRANYRTWQTILDSRGDLEVVFPSLPPGICPQVLPVRADAPRAVREELRRCGVGGVEHWPRLADRVRADPAYDTTRRLADEILTIPIHQHVDPHAIETVGDRLRR